LSPHFHKKSPAKEEGEDRIKEEGRGPTFSRACYKEKKKKKGDLGPLGGKWGGGKKEVANGGGRGGKRGVGGKEEARKKRKDMFIFRLLKKVRRKVEKGNPIGRCDPGRLKEKQGSISRRGPRGGSLQTKKKGDSRDIFFPSTVERKGILRGEKEIRDSRDGKRVTGGPSRGSHAGDLLSVNLRQRKKRTGGGALGANGQNGPIPWGKEKKKKKKKVVDPSPSHFLQKKRLFTFCPFRIGKEGTTMGDAKEEESAKNIKTITSRGGT